MATANISSSIEQLKHEFCNRFAHLSEQQRQQLWLQSVAHLPSSSPHNRQQPSQAHEVPRSMSNTAANMTQLLATGYGQMGRVQSAPAMEQTMSISSDHGLQRSSSTMSGWQSCFDDASYVYSDASLPRQPPLQSIQETTLPCDNMVEYSPADYLNFIGSSDSPTPYPQPPLHVQLTPNNQWMPSLDDSASPSTPSTALMTPVTLASNSMSRQSSSNPHFVEDIPMLRSDSSMYPIISEDGSFSFAPDVPLVSKNISAYADTPLFSTTGFTGQPSETSFLSSAPVSASVVPALASSDSEPCLVEDMRRSASASWSSSESDASHASPSSSSSSPPGSRQVRREREIKAHAGRCKLAPKADPSANATTQTASASPNAQMMQIQSEDGSSRHVGVISKAPYVRPQHPKILCPHCNERPEGFRGTHELDRHVARAHTAVRKGFVCVAPAFNKNFLSGCKHCRNKKVYGAYYNAAAHLRRAHFHPRKRGRKGKNDEKRGGIGGGDDPPMDYLKQHWIREIEVENKNKNKASHAASQSPESASDAAEPDVPALDATRDPELAFPLHPSTGRVPMPVPMPSMEHPTHFVDYSVYGAYTQMPQPTSDVAMNDFEFDVYRT